MRALTLHQPWAALVAAGIKLIENRPRRPPVALIGQRFAIHAGLFTDEKVFALIAEDAPDINIAWLRTASVHRGKIVATARLVGWVSTNDPTLRISPPEQARWFFGPIGYVLADVRALATPVAARGMQGFWPVPADVERQVLEQERAT